MDCCHKIGGLLRGQFQDQATLPAYEGEKLAIHLQAVAPEHPVTFNTGGAQRVLGQLVQHGLGCGPKLSSVDAGIRRLRQRLTAGVRFSFGFHGATVGIPAPVDNSPTAVSMGGADRHGLEAGHQAGLCTLPALRAVVFAVKLLWRSGGDLPVSRLVAVSPRPAVMIALLSPFDLQFAANPCLKCPGALLFN